MAEMDRCDHIRSSALAFAVEFANGQTATAFPWSADGVVATAGAFHKFLLGGHQSLTKEDVLGVEAAIREEVDERTHVGRGSYPTDNNGIAS
jgi:hypothetical protein